MGVASGGWTKAQIKAVGASGVFEGPAKDFELGKIECKHKWSRPYRQSSRTLKEEIWTAVRTN